MIRRVAAPVLALAAAAALLAGCAPTSIYQGFQAIDAKPQDAKVGEDTKSTVMSRLGTPSAVSTFDPNQWYYISQVVEYQSFYKPRTVRREVVALSFDRDSEKVTRVDTLTLKDGRVIAYNGRETPTRGRQLSVLEQLLGNLGQSNLLGDQNITPGERPVGR